MGALDWLKEFENRTLDVASFNLLKRNYEMQEENCRLLKDKAELLEAQVTELREEVTRLRTENAELRRSVESRLQEQDFKIQDGIAFRRIGEDEYEETPYCPTCKVVLGHPLGNRIFTCPKCNYATRVHVTLNTLMARLKAATQHKQV